MVIDYLRSSVAADSKEEPTADINILIENASATRTTEGGDIDECGTSRLSSKSTSSKNKSTSKKRKKSGSSTSATKGDSNSNINSNSNGINSQDASIRIDIIAGEDVCSPSIEKEVKGISNENKKDSGIFDNSATLLNGAIVTDTDKQEVESIRAATEIASVTVCSDSINIADASADTSIPQGISSSVREAAATVSTITSTDSTISAILDVRSVLLSSFEKSSNAQKSYDTHEGNKPVDYSVENLDYGVEHVGYAVDPVDCENRYGNSIGVDLSQFASMGLRAERQSFFGRATELYCEDRRKKRAEAKAQRGRYAYILYYTDDINKHKLIHSYNALYMFELLHLPYFCFLY
jgi:hypothetical protein